MANNLQTSHGLVSVLVPLHNKADWIESTLLSVLGQTHTNLEVLVIDDGSTDRSAEVASKINDSRLVFVGRENRGANATRNELLSLARGTYVQFLDADDLLLPRKIELQLAGLEAGADVSLCPVWKGEVGGPLQPPLSDLGSVEAIVGHGIHTLAPLHRLSSLKSIGGWTDGLAASQEYDLHLRLVSHGLWQRPHLVETPLGVWRTVEGSTSSDEHRVYRAKAESLRNAAATAPQALSLEISRALANSARHLARSRDFINADRALKLAESVDPSARNEYPRRIRWVPHNATLHRLEWAEHRARTFLDRVN